MNSQTYSLSKEWMILEDTQILFSLNRKATIQDKVAILQLKGH